LPVISKGRDKLEECEFIPFRRAAGEGVDSIMTAHIAMPGLADSKLGDDHPSKSLPASLNPDAIKILREEMKYEGVIISDCLEMDGVRATYGTEKGAVMAVNVRRLYTILIERNTNTLSRQELIALWFAIPCLHKSVQLNRWSKQSGKEKYLKSLFKLL
jgi:beta-glucosidase-like glycosyl hydrolase